MVSIFKTAAELDKVHELQRVSLESFARAIAASAEYAVEADPLQAAAFRDHLQAIETLLRAGGGAQGVQSAEASFRGELRDYQEKTHQHLDRLHQDVTAAAAAMKLFAEGIVSNNTDHEKQVEKELKTLEVVARGENLREIRAGIQGVIGNIAVSMDRMKSNNQFVIVQLQDEIRLLHMQLEAERRSRSADRSSGAWNRQKTAEHIDMMLRQNDAFCLLVVRLRGFKQLERGTSRNAVDAALKGMLARLHPMLAEQAVIGRWTPEEFVAILPAAPSDTISFSREVTKKLSGSYTVEDDGKQVSVGLQVTTALVERRAGVDPGAFYTKLEKFSAALAEG